jgi:hypothetical protein
MGNNLDEFMSWGEFQERTCRSRRDATAQNRKIAIHKRTYFSFSTLLSSVKEPIPRELLSRALATRGAAAY